MEGCVLQPGFSRPPLSAMEVLCVVCFCHSNGGEMRKTLVTFILADSLTQRFKNPNAEWDLSVNCDLFHVILVQLCVSQRPIELEDV